MPRLIANLLLILVVAASLAACESSPAGTSGQIVARVNGVEISVHQLNRMAGRSGALSKEQREVMVERLVQRELAVQQAQSLKLDRQPEVMLRLEEARRDALAAAWADHLAAGTATSDPNAAARYYAAHPGLFAERKLYRLQELAIPVQSPNISEAELRLQKGERFAELRSWLLTSGSRYSDREIIRLAEQLPIEAVERLRQARPGQTIAFRSPRGLTAYQLKSAEVLPVDWATAAPLIGSYLESQARNEKLERELKRLRTKAEIRHVGDSGPS